MIIISEYIDKNIDYHLINFIGEVLNNEKLKEWKIKIWSCDGEGECGINEKYISVGICSDLIKTKRLFLHEIAHAFFKEIDNDARNHNEKFINRYVELQKKYNIQVDNRI